MDALAETWSRSGRKPDDLYDGNIIEIIKELRVWLIAREDRNHANFRLLWDFLDNNATIIDLANQYGNINDIRIAPFKAKHVKSVERVKVRRIYACFIQQTLKFNLRSLEKIGTS